MKYPRTVSLMTLTVLLLAGLWSAAFGQSGDGNLANVIGGGSSVRFEVVSQNAGVTLIINAPDGRSFTKESRGGASPVFDLSDKSLPDGTYSYELRIKPSLTAGQKDALMNSRGKDGEPESERAARKRPDNANLVQSGSFAVVNGQIIVAGLSEGGRAAQPSTPSNPARKAAAATTVPAASGNTFARLRNHRLSMLAPMFDFVIADDLIVQGSACVGLDCVDGENFGFDTIRVKENNTRFQFDDTSTSAGFASNNWQIRANSSASGGGNFLAFVDQGTTGNSETGTIVFEVDAGAPANSLRVSSSGKVGIRTATPVLDMHVNSTDTPAMRMEQNNSGGFTAQTWDIAGNEANFFVRDVTSGSRLPFRIRPGAPTSSLDIAASGNVGIGTASPAAKLDVRDTSVAGVTALLSDTTGGLLVRLRGIGTAGTQRGALELGNAGTIKSAIFSDANDSFINGGGRLGINTATPDQTLSVNGDADKVGGGSWLNFSDERLKTITGKFRSGLKAVMQLDPIRYEYLKNNALGLKSDGEHIGFGAQSLQKIIPEAVTKNSEGYLMVNNDPIIWTMLNAIKEQQKEIEQLKGQIQKLRASSHRRRR